MADQNENTGSNKESDANTDEGNKQQKETEDNNENNDDNLADLWQDEADKSGENQQTQQTQLQIQTQQVDPNKVFNEHIEKLNLSDGIDLSAISADLSQGNTESLNKAFGTIAANVYRQSIIDASKIIDKKVQEGVDKAIKQSTNAVHGNMAVDKMQSTLNFTKNPAINPVATAVLAQLIKKGKSVDDAINGVRKFFQNTAALSGKELGLKRPPNSRPGGQSFGSAVIDTEDDEINWMDTLNI